MKCAHCNDTGKIGNSRHLDCSYCEVGVIRARIDGAVGALRRIGETEEDIWWNLYQMGEKAGQQAPGDIVTYPTAPPVDAGARITVLRNAYVRLLSLGHYAGRETIAGQSELSGLRDAICSLTGESGQTVQEDAEADALSMRMLRKV